MSCIKPASTGCGAPPSIALNTRRSRPYLQDGNHSVGTRPRRYRSLVGSAIPLLCHRWGEQLIGSPTGGNRFGLRHHHTTRCEMDSDPTASGVKNPNRQRARLGSGIHHGQGRIVIRAPGSELAKESIEACGAVELEIKPAPMYRFDKTPISRAGNQM